MTTDCRAFVAKLGSPQAAGDAELAAHLAQCADCRAAARVVGQLERTRADPEPRALAELAARIRDRHRERPLSRRQPAMLAAAAIAAAAAFAVIVRVGPDPAAPVAGGPGAAELAEALDFDDLADSFALEELEWVDAALAEDELSGLDDLLDSSQGEGPI